MNKEKLRRIPHLISGFIILLHSYERFETGHNSYLIFLVAGLVFLSVALLHHKLVARLPFIDALFFIIEASLSFVIAYEYFEAGKQSLPYVYVVAGIIQIVVIFILMKKNKLKTHH